MISSSNLQNFQDVRLELDPDKILFAPDNEGVIQYEEWRDIPNYEGYYQCSSFGRIKSLSRKVRNSVGFRTIKIRIRKQFLINSGYFSVRLNKNGFSENILIHQLLTICFFGHKPDKLNIVVDHKDNVKTHNYLWNLQLISHRLNSSKDKKGKTSLYTGVRNTESGKKWRVDVRLDNQQYYIGRFENQESAKTAYEEALSEIDKYNSVSRTRNKYLIRN